VYEYRNLTPEQRAELLRQRSLAGHPRHRPPHWQEGRGRFLITAATYEHRPYFQTDEERAHLWSEVMKELTEAGVACDAWVFVPNHHHLLVDGESLSAVGPAIGRAHGRTSRELNLRDSTPGRQVWYRFTDRKIRNESHYHATLNYIHYNPVKHGYVRKPLEWACSSVHWYLEHYGFEWLRDTWRGYPVRDYGKGWDW
jgi:putative transposase